MEGRAHASQLLQSIRQEDHAGGAVTADRKHFNGVVKAGAESLGGALGERYDLLRVRQKRLSFLCQADRAGRSDKQRRAQFLLQGLDLLADRRMCHMKRLRRLRKVQVFRNRQKAGKLKGIHFPPPQLVRIPFQ